MKILGMWIIVGLLIAPCVLNAQSKTKPSREEKEALKDEEQKLQRKKIATIIDSSHFVLEANYLRDRKGQTFPVNSSINFIMINGNKAVFQFGTAHTIVYNGLGVYTVEGKVSKYKISKNEKHGNYNILINISSTSGFFDIHIDVSRTGIANANINTTTRFKLNYSGNLVSLDESLIFKGQSIP